MNYIIETALELGLFYSLVPLALFLSYRVLDIADLTTDGSFVLGCAVSVTFTLLGHPILGLFMAMAAGACAGGVTAFLQTNLGVPSILAGIITNTGLYTVNLAVMGWRSNVSLLKQDTIFTLFKQFGIGSNYYQVILAGAVVFLTLVFVICFLKTRLGLSIRATGDNIDMVKASSINPAFTTAVGLCIANAMSALSGAMVAQAQKTADINSGSGIVVIGLACLIIGETIIGKSSITKGAIAAIAGSIFYRLMYAIVLRTGIVPIESMKLATALVVAIAIASPTLRDKILLNRKKHVLHTSRGGKRC